MAASRRAWGLVAGVLGAGLLAFPAAATVTSLTYPCDATKTLRVVTISFNTYEYFFTPTSGGPPIHFPGVTGTSHARFFLLPPGTYRLTYKQPNASPVGTYGPDVVIKPYKIVNGVCVYPVGPAKR